MKKIPWKGIAIGTGSLALLVVGRCFVTAGRFLYYGGVYWQREIVADPWLYVGMASASACVASLLMLADQKSRQRKEKGDHKDGCGQ